MLHYPNMDQGLLPHTDLWAVIPSVGVRDGYRGGQLQGRIGYAIVHNPAFVQDAQTVAPFGDESGLTVTGQLDQWGTDRVGGQAIVNWNLGASTLWSRARLSTRMARTASGAAVRLGGEAVLQAWLGPTVTVTSCSGGMCWSRISYTAWELGPALEYSSRHFVGTLSGGPKLGGDSGSGTSAYVHLDLSFPM